jgi:hypothetical protein
MATNAAWTVVFEDKRIINQSVKNAEGYPIAYAINDDSFWNDSKWSNIWAIQYKDNDPNYSESVEYRDDTPHASWTNASLGDFRNQFITKWDSAHLAQLQADWDADVIVTYNVEDGSVNTTESEADQVARKGARPTSYTSA